jgi:hypothetical protein
MKACNKFSINLHINQKKIFLDSHRFKLLVCGRRFGKSHELRTEVIYAAVSFNQPYDPNFPPVVALIMPTLKQAKSVHWKALKGLLKDAPFVESINNTDYRITLKGNKPDIILRGVNEDAGDGLRGNKLYFAACDEFQDFKEGIWDNVILPALGDTTGSKATLVGTPKGKNHPLYHFYQKIKDLSDWAYFHFTTKDNPFFPKKQLREAKKQMPPKSYNQEYRASFEDFEGQIFDQFTINHKITEIPADLSYYLGADWGDINCALTVVGLSKDLSNFYIVDSWYNTSGQPITQDEFLDKVAKFCTQYNIYRCYLPDDRPAAILAARKLGKEKGITGLQRAVQVNRNAIKIMEGCDIINSLFYQNKLHIKQSLDQVISQFENYHRATDAEGKLINKPADNQVDHLCFVDSTEVLVPGGYKKISDLRVGDLVDTPMGFKPVTFTANRLAKVIKVEANNEVLTVTPDHPFLSKDAQWIRADMLYNSYIITKEILCKQLLNYTGLPTEKPKGTNIFTATPIKLKSSMLNNTYIGKYGLTILEKYQKDIISIIKMGMFLITELKTWNVWKPQNIVSITKMTLVLGVIQKKVRDTSQRLGSLLNPGILLKKVFNGILSMVRSVWRKEKLLQRNAQYVALNSPPKTTTRPSALTNVNLNIEEIQEWITSPESVPSAKQLSQLTNTPEHSVALVNVVPNSESVARVYCIEVEEAHSYYVKAGDKSLLVSNCDAARYVITTLHQKIQIRNQ